MSETSRARQSARACAGDATRAIPRAFPRVFPRVFPYFVRLNAQGGVQGASGGVIGASGTQGAQGTGGTQGTASGTIGTSSAGIADGAQRYRIVPARHWASMAATLVALALLALVLYSVLGNPRWEWSVFAQWFLAGPVISGLAQTLVLTALSACFGFALAIPLALARLARAPLPAACSWAYIWLFRSIPPIVLLLLLNNLGYLYETVSLGIPFTHAVLFSAQTTDLLSPFWAAVLGLTLNHAAFAAEAIRGGILSVDQGQREAAAALGLPHTRQVWRIVLPQAMRAILPVAFNDVIGLAKGTSVVYILAMPDLFYTVQIIYHRNLEVIPLLMVATIWYLVILTVLSVVQRYVERHYARGATREQPAVIPLFGPLFGRLIAQFVARSGIGRAGTRRSGTDAQNLTQAGKAVGNRAARAGNAAENCLMQAENVARNRAAQTENVTENRPTQAENVAGNRPTQTENVVENRAAQAENVAGNRAVQAGNATENRPTQVGNVVENRPTQTENVVENRATQAGNAAENRAAQAENVAGNRAVQAGNVVENRPTQTENVAGNRAIQAGSVAENRPTQAENATENRAAQAGSQAGNVAENRAATQRIAADAASAAHATAGATTNTASAVHVDGGTDSAANPVENAAAIPAETAADTATDAGWAQQRVGGAVGIHNVSKSFGALKVLDHVSLLVASGSVTAILGPSGSGKSTLLRTINHLERVDDGFIDIDGELVGYRRDGHTLYELGEKAILRHRAEVGMVFQNFNLFPHLRVLENLVEAPLAAGVPRAQAEALARALLARVGLADKASAWPRQLSGGQQQRVAIARALALRPKVLLFDEPTSALDPELVNEVLDVIRQLARSGTTLIIVTHEIGFAREVADTVVFMQAGRILESGPPDQVLRNPSHPRTREFLSRVL